MANSPAEPKGAAQLSVNETHAAGHHTRTPTNPDGGSSAPSAASCFRNAAASTLRLLPGLALAALLTGAAFLAAQLPGVALLGPLGAALLLGATWRLLFSLPTGCAPGARFAAKSVLRAGVVLLGARLHFGVLWQAGPAILILSLLIIGVGIAAMEGLGRALRLRRGLRLTLAIGSAVCGASAIAAAAPVVGARDDEVSASVGIISVLGALGALGFSIAAPMLGVSATHYGMLTGATLQEVGHVLAAGAAASAEALDLATLTKLTRVALLAPVLLVVSAALARRTAPSSRSGSGTGSYAAASGGAATTARPPALPGFLLGFLLVGAVNSAGLIPAAAGAQLQLGSALLTAVAMAAIGLQVDPAALRRTGGRAVLLAGAGFALLLLIAAVFMRLFVEGA